MNMRYERKLNLVECVCELCKCNFTHISKHFYKKRFCGNKCRVEYSNKKQKITCLKKYGVISPTLNVKIRNKQKATCLKNNGVLFPAQNVKIRNKQKATCLKKNGNEIPFNCDIIKNKIKETKIKLYNNINFNNPIKNKKTCFKKYGVDHVLQNPTIKLKFLNKIYDHHFNSIKNRLEKCNIILNINRKEYVGTGIDKTYSFTCKKCNNIFSSVLIRGILPRCKKCFPYNISKDECNIRDIISENLKVFYNDKSIISPKELDIYIPSLNLAIEYDSLYYHSELCGKKPINYHLNKTIECEKKNIKLIHIFGDEWKDKKSIIQSKINYLTKSKNIYKIYSRNCIIKEIDYTTSSSFLEQNHLQGKDMSSIKIGLFYNNELVSVMTFGKLRLSLGNKIRKIGEYEMYRFCNKINTTVIGSAGKLLNYFIKTYNPVKIISYADRRWVEENNNIYKTLKFNLTLKTNLNYWYIINNKRYHRFNFRKDQLSKKLSLFDPLKTEWENMQLNGYDRIWDCGSLKYEWNKK